MRHASAGVVAAVALTWSWVARAAVGSGLGPAAGSTRAGRWNSLACSCLQGVPREPPQHKVSPARNLACLPASG